ncbi:hypothetical protein C8R45DRAFT_935168 [Mycena sanguinolenta]|nr:hypothetical protein C8R45DRAFT_935168 [Mycena sanguinolenta]
MPMLSELYLVSGFHAPRAGSERGSERSAMMIEIYIFIVVGMSRRSPEWHMQIVLVDSGFRMDEELDGQKNDWVSFSKSDKIGEKQVLRVFESYFHRDDESSWFQKLAHTALEMSLFGSRSRALSHVLQSSTRRPNVDHHETTIFNFFFKFLALSTTSGLSSSGLQPCRKITETRAVHTVTDPYRQAMGDYFLRDGALKCNDRRSRNYAVTGGTGGTRAVRVSGPWFYGRLNRIVRKLRRNSYGRGRNTGGCKPYF